MNEQNDSIALVWLNGTFNHFYPLRGYPCLTLLHLPTYSPTLPPTSLPPSTFPLSAFLPAPSSPQGNGTTSPKSKRKGGLGFDLSTMSEGEFGNALEKATSGSGPGSKTWTKGWTGVQSNGIVGGSADDSAVGLSAKYSSGVSASSDPIRLADNSTITTSSGNDWNPKD